MPLKYILKEGFQKLKYIDDLNTPTLKLLSRKSFYIKNVLQIIKMIQD